MTGVLLVIYSESTAAKAAGILSEVGAPEETAQQWMALAPVDVVTVEGPKGVTVTMPYSALLPPLTQNAYRDVTFVYEDAPARSRTMDLLHYDVYFSQDDAIYRISVALGSFMRLFRIGFIVLVVLELLILLTRAGKDRRMVRRMLDPITEFTRAAQTLNAVSGQLDPEKMQALAGKLENINAARLDTRISVDETQSELKNLARAINSMLDRINASYRAQVRFVSDASHELRTPISVIQGYANLLDRWGKNDEKTLQESISAIKEEAANMKELVEQLLFLARGDNDTIVLQTESFNLAELAAEVYAETKMIDASHEFRLKATDTYIRADKALIKQALRILVDNAVKYTDAGGTITLVSEAAGGMAALSVRDDGIGIAPEIVPHIFERFYRADESRARATGGAGLGLSIAKWIVARHDGHLEVLSREGIGTRITLVLPSAPMPAPVLPPVTSAAPLDPNMASGQDEQTPQ